MKNPVVGLILQLQYKPQIQGLSERLKKSKDIRRVKMFSSLWERIQTQVFEIANQKSVGIRKPIHYIEKNFR